ncbi:MAG: GNAT family N-acetyltransferase [Candidatus Dactylopiibacterium carminicum]|uniref:GNAT family N-acetyltransferase n=1 Tax=Candidatus Dactylopiibacterium carminicum TaxID=857335 RepID=A0A272ENH4_9RHOO|nr:GNAT family N-acetyltransferase [Candidatus Dactylopiibacterium carminicum]KAF7600702.1 GNAT family N-acetyltransferase [Candidatus Dactylopiibacterium carminicum]PAS91667.1 MAG: GNAT family N-acetyltransferase [Candidatus Dactylopiibacterium carminicum]PAS96551.1 MAG: GNAT family N-acetyltransferase [Candidatus Dactylopiibacterium carminicum]PAT00702.1 MAG: hypothetical protein BSR46_00910 [Candidatus Dactylopiibacterium carminicum]
MEMRVATAGDVQAMFELRTSVRENHMSRAALAELGVTPESLPGMLEGCSRGWVVHEEGVLLGFAMADAGEACVFALFVHPAHEGRGVGRRLLDTAEGWLLSQACSEAWLLTDSRPEVRANGFYRALGWRAEGVQDDGQMLFRKRLVAG